MNCTKQCLYIRWWCILVLGHSIEVDPALIYIRRSDVSWWSIDRIRAAAWDYYYYYYLRRSSATTDQPVWRVNQINPATAREESCNSLAFPCTTSSTLWNTPNHTRLLFLWLICRQAKWRRFMTCWKELRFSLNSSINMLSHIVTSRRCCLLSRCRHCNAHDWLMPVAIFFYYPACPVACWPTIFWAGKKMEIKMELFKSWRNQLVSGSAQSIRGKGI